MYTRHIDHRSGAPWGPQLREGGKKFSRQSRDNSFPGQGASWGAPWRGPWGVAMGGPMGGPGAWGLLGDPGVIAILLLLI